VQNGVSGKSDTSSHLPDRSWDGQPEQAEENGRIMMLEDEIDLLKTVTVRSLQQPAGITGSPCGKAVELPSTRNALPSIPPITQLFGLLNCRQCWFSASWWAM
jgi:hypothetical protein